MTAGMASLSWPNDANHIAKHLSAKWPMLVDIKGLWFTGSQVWEYIYHQKPSAFSDTDMFELTGWRTWFHRSPIAEVVRRLGLTEGMSIPRQSSRPNGQRYMHPRHGQVDLWRAKSTAAESIASYPALSHAHCRAAFSFTEGLVVLPNEAAK